MSNLNREFCSYEQALALKELGFDEECVATYYDGDYKIEFSIDSEFITNNSMLVNNTVFVAAPLTQQAFRFFREKYNLIGFVEFDSPNNIDRFDNDYTAWVFQSVEPFKQNWIKVFNIYEEAEQVCLNKLIEIAKESE